MRPLLAAVVVLLVVPVLALDGDPRMHDPSTVVVQDGKFYSYGTGRGIPISPSPMTGGRGGAPAPSWKRLPAGKPGPDVIARGGNNTWAPDVIHSGDKLLRLLLGARHAAEIRDRTAGRHARSTRTSPDYKWEDGGPVVWSDGVEDSNAIDPGVLLRSDRWIACG